MCEICQNFPTDVESTRIVENLWEICHRFLMDFTRKLGQQFTPIQWCAPSPQPADVPTSGTFANRAVTVGTTLAVAAFV
ncbi:hypothetical protein Tco_0155406 [Tanacetum coccineum]